MTYEQRRDMITTHAWEKWTNNGLAIERDLWDEATRTVQDAVNNTYYDEIDDIEWLNATLARLGQ